MGCPFESLKNKPSSLPSLIEEVNKKELLIDYRETNTYLLKDGKIIGLNIPSFSKDYMTNKLLFMPFGVVWLYLVFLYLKRETKKITFEDVSLKHFVLILVFSLVLPLIVLIEFSKK